MKILLIGNYENSQQQSMQRFAELMRQALTADGHEVWMLCPPVILGSLCPGETWLAKWLGYIDRFLLFPPRLRRQMQWADVVHICDQANAVYIPQLRGKPHVLTCHDMFAIRAARGEIAESPTGMTGRIYQRWILSNLRKALLVTCVSRQTGQDVQRVAGLAIDHVAVVPNAINYPYRPMQKKEALSHLQALGLDGTKLYFLHVGGNQWYKNRLGVVRIFAELVKVPAYQNHLLLMAGKPWTNEMRQLVRQLGVEQQAVELVNVLSEELRALYSTAEAFLFPSLQEGFGWPIIEAQACGCPVITTERAPMTEVGGNAAIYIEPANAPDAASVIVAGLTGRERLRKDGLENAARYSVQTMVVGYTQCYRSVLQKAKRT